MHNIEKLVQATCMYCHRATLQQFFCPLYPLQKNTAKRNIKPLISGTEKMTAPHVWPWKYTTIKPLVSGTADMTYSQIVWLYDPFSHMPPQYLQYKSCRLHLLYAVFNLCACRISHLILLPRAHHSISGLNVNYPFPVFPHSVSDLWSEQS